jgi:tRNA(Ile)-lysidine synthase
MAPDDTGMLDPALPPGRWAVGVSGGADSVALLLLLLDRPDVQPHVVHLDHETRGEESRADAAFVAALAGRLGAPCTVARRSDVERDLGPPPPNPSARYRRARLALFRRVVDAHGLAGVVLAHHADDQAETVMLRLLRGGGPRSLVGMAERSTIGGLTVLRPLLGAGSANLRQLLRDRGQPWREDASNASDRYLRNRVRPALARDPQLADALRHMGDAARHLVGWLDARGPALAESFAVTDLADAPAPLARHAAGRWLAARGVPADAINRAACDRLAAMASDAAAAPVQMFAGAVIIRRSGGTITAASPPPPRVH